MEGRTKLYLLALGAGIYALGYATLLLAALRGELEGLAGVAAILMATGILLALVFGVLLFKLQAEVLGQL